MTKTDKIIAYLTANPDASVADVAKKFKAHRVTVYQVRSKMRKAASTSGGAEEGAEANTASNESPTGRPRRGRKRRAARALTPTSVAPRRRRDGDDSDLLDRLKVEYQSLGQLIELLENPTARDVLARLTTSD